MQPSSIILCEGVLSLAIPIGLAAWELRSLRKPPGGNGQWRDSGPAAPNVPPPPSATASPRPRARVMEDA